MAPILLVADGNRWQMWIFVILIRFVRNARSFLLECFLVPIVRCLCQEIILFLLFDCRSLIQIGDMFPSICCGTDFVIVHELGDVHENSDLSRQLFSVGDRLLNKANLFNHLLPSDLLRLKKPRTLLQQLRKRNFWIKFPIVSLYGLTLSLVQVMRINVVSSILGVMSWQTADGTTRHALTWQSFNELAAQKQKISLTNNLSSNSSTGEELNGNNFSVFCHHKSGE